MSIKESQSDRMKRLIADWEDHHKSITNARVAFNDGHVTFAEYFAFRKRARGLRNAVHAEFMALARPKTEPVVTPVPAGDLEVLIDVEVHVFDEEAGSA